MRWLSTLGSDLPLDRPVLRQHPIRHGGIGGSRDYPVSVIVAAGTDADGEP